MGCKSYARESPKTSLGPMDQSDDRPVLLHAHHDERLANQHRLREWLVEVLSVNFPDSAERLADEFVLRHEKSLRADVKKNLTCFVMVPQ